MSETTLNIRPADGSAPQPVVSEHSNRNYAKRLDDLFVFAAGRPLIRNLLMEWRTATAKLAPSTDNVRLSTMRKLLTEARRNGMLGAEEVANLTDVPHIGQQGKRLGNWLTRDQAKALLAVPDRQKLKGKFKISQLREKKGGSSAR